MFARASVYMEYLYHPVVGRKSVLSQNGNMPRCLEENMAFISKKKKKKHAFLVVPRILCCFCAVSAPICAVSFWQFFSKR